MTERLPLVHCASWDFSPLLVAFGLLAAVLIVLALAVYVVYVVLRLFTSEA